MGIMFQVNECLKMKSRRWEKDIDGSIIVFKELGEFKNITKSVKEVLATYNRSTKIKVFHLL